MELTITAVDPDSGTRTDQRLRVTADLPVATLAETLAGRPAVPLYAGDRLLDPASLLPETGIHDGTVLGIGAPAHDPDAIEITEQTDVVQVEVHAVSGPDAGRIWRLGVGSHEIGSGPLCTLRLTGDDVPVGGLWLTLRPDGSARWQRTGELDGSVRARWIGPPADDLATSAIRLAPEDEAHDPKDPPKPKRTTRDPGTDEQPVGGTDDPGCFTWPANSDLRVGPVLLRLGGDLEPAAAVRQSPDGFGLDYNRPPRLSPHLDDKQIRLPSQPTKAEKRPFPWMMVLSPVVMGLLMVWLLHSLYFLALMVMMPMMMLANWTSGRKSGRREKREAIRLYHARLEALETEVHAAVERERLIRNEMAPDPARVAVLATMPGVRLWERRRTDPDHLLLRLGTADQPSVKELHDHNREENHQSIHWQIPDAPITLHLPSHGVVGLAGAPTPTLAVARWLVVQAAALHSPNWLRMVVLTEPDRAEDWSWVRWLPHLRPLSPQDTAAVAIGNDPASTVARVSELVTLIKARQRAAAATETRNYVPESTVLLIADGSLRLRDVPGLVQILTEGPQVGVLAICIDREQRLLPEECLGVVNVEGTELTLRQHDLPDLRQVRADQVEPQWCEQVARALAGIRDVSPDYDTGLPRQLRMLELLDLEPPDSAELLARWSVRPASTTFLLGRDFEGPLAIDLSVDGPHGLVAGTTGSGKSELLQTMVASLASVNRPDELTFVLVDYKGGSAFKDCVGLPHTLGMVTDLDSHLVERALTSLEAELRRRERILAGADARDLLDYQVKRSADPELPRLARLVLVIDEFAAMVKEIPDFVPGLIGISQRGRSLGIHLILATQRPGGVVTADLRANTNLRIALRVTGQMESQDILETNEAAAIPASIPGRALIQRGPKTADLFQVAWSGAERPDAQLADLLTQAAGPSIETMELSWTDLGRPTAPPGPPAGPAGQAAPVIVPTDLTALVSAIREAVEQLTDYTPQPSPWQPALAETLLLDDLPAIDVGDLVIPYALEDLPALQSARVAAVDLRSFGHLYVIGAPRSGRTQFLRTLAGSAAKTASCADVHIYGIDAAGGGLAALTRLPHCGAVVSRDLERIGRLIDRLLTELSHRQDLAALHNVTGLTELRELLPRDERPAHLLVLVDGWDALTALLDEHDGGRQIQSLTSLIREGGAVGIHVIATSERALLSGRLSAHNDHKLLLRQADRSDFLAGGPRLLKKIPAVVPAGRGWHTLTETETQIAMLATGGGSDQVNALRAIAELAVARDAKVSRDRRPFSVAALPTSVGFEQAFEKVPPAARRPMWALVGLGGDDAGAVGADLAAAASTFAVLGPPGGGRSNALAAMAVSLLAGGTALVVLTPRDSPLRALAQHARVTLFADVDPTEDEVRNALTAHSGPAVVLLDDADLLVKAECDGLLRELVVSGRDQHRGLIFAGTPDCLQVGVSGWISLARRARSGIIIQPQQALDGDAIGVRLSSSVVRTAAHPGRAFMAGPGGKIITLQIPLTTLRS
ncbi:FtsK/SpoIIIE domain-containing protein [Kribbella sp. NPDC056861]|uniref:FtsK/SpoIIIE domain-containing protein n=1 Tax=Kribbella sp. NPDC056861 TaxID=3154857 RepID=UPI00341FB34D